MTFTIDREEAMESDEIALFGLEHPVIQELLNLHSALEPERRAVFGCLEELDGVNGLFTLWHVLIDSPGSHIRQHIVRLGITSSGKRSPRIERMENEMLGLHPYLESRLGKERIAALVNDFAPEMLHRELSRQGVLQDGSSYSSKLIACFEIV